MPRIDDTGTYGRQTNDLAPETEIPVVPQRSQNARGVQRGKGRCDGTGRGGGRGMGRGACRYQLDAPTADSAPETPQRNSATGTYGGGRGIHQHRNICNQTKKTKS